MKDSDLIRRNHAISAAKTGADDWDGGCNKERDRYIDTAFADIPAVDAVEVVRCDECWFRPKGKTYCIELERHTGNRFYCAFGQRREEEHNAAD